MSLLEDIFLHDEAGEAQELERVIEGDEYEDRRRSDSDDDSEKEDEAVEDKRRIDPTQAKPKRVVKNPRVILNPARLTGPRGIQVIPEHFKDFKFKGKGHEKEDLDLVLKKLEHWAYRLFPKFQFDDCLKKIETLGKKRPVMVHLQKIRSDQYQTDEVVVQKDSSDDEAAPTNEVEDEFDKLLGEQIELARAKVDTPGSNKKGFQTPSTTDKRTSFMMPKATSSPSISDEQRERMLLNRKLAEERRLARLKQNTSTTNEATANNTSCIIEVNEPENEEIEEPIVKKTNNSNVINSSDDEETENNLVRNDTSNVLHAKSVIEENVTSKHNRSNVIDSTDEETADNDVVTVDLNDENNTFARKNISNNPKVTEKIDLTNLGSNFVPNYSESNVSIDLVNTKPNKITEDNIIIDITDQEIRKTATKHIIEGVDLSNIDEQAETDNIMKKRRYKSAVIDSSGEECDITSTNHEVTVQIHKIDGDVDKINRNKKSLIRDIDDNENLDIEAQKFEEEIVDDDNITNNKDKMADEKMAKDLNTEENVKNIDVVDDLLKEIHTNTDVSEPESLSEKENVHPTDISSQNLIISEESAEPSNNKENLETKDGAAHQIDEFMDVDFDEDF